MKHFVNLHAKMAQNIIFFGANKKHIFNEYGQLNFRFFCCFFVFAVLVVNLLEENWNISKELFLANTMQIVNEAIKPFSSNVFISFISKGKCIFDSLFSGCFYFQIFSGEISSPVCNATTVLFQTL